MTQARQNPRLAVEALEESRIGSEIVRKDLQRDGAVELRLAAM